MSALIKREYFDLVNRLNQSNKLKNQTTEIYFYVDESDSSSEKLFVGTSSVQRVLLCEKKLNGVWVSGNLSGYDELEYFITKLLNSEKTPVSITDFIKSHIFKLE